MPSTSQEQLDHDLVHLKENVIRTPFLHYRPPSNKRPFFELKFEISARALIRGNTVCSIESWDISQRNFDTVKERAPTETEKNRLHTIAT